MRNIDANMLKFEIPEIIHGLGALAKIGQCARRLGGERVLVVTDPGVIEAGWMDEGIKHLKNEDLKYVVYDHVVSNPRDFQVEQGVRFYLKNRCDVIVAIGGGSPIDTAKGIAILVSNHGAIHDYMGCNLVTQPIPPLICTPTTAGTGADVSQFAVIGDTRTDTRLKSKMTILSRAIMPDISLNDPLLLETKTDELMASTGMDTLTHAIEAYLSSLSWSLTDPHANHAVSLVARHLELAVKTKKIKALEGMSIACIEAGMAFSNAILGAVHALAHPLGGLYDLHHGLVNSVMLPPVMRRNMAYALPKFAQLARALGIETRGMSDQEAAAHVPNKIEALTKVLGLPQKLTQLGVKAEDIPLLAEMAQNDICMLTNPYHYSQDEIKAMYMEVL